jgi:hypothetical protein
MPPVVYRNKSAVPPVNFGRAATFWEFFAGLPDFAVRIEVELSDKL